MGPKVTPAKPEAILIEIIAQILLRQPVVGTQNKSLGVADHDVQPAEHPAVRSIGFGSVVIPRQSWTIAAVAITENGAALFDAGLGKPFHRGLLNIVRRLHLEILGMALVSQRQRHENLCFFSSPAALLALGRATEEGVVKLNRPTEDMGIVPLSHGPSEPSQEIPCRLVSDADDLAEPDGGDPALVLGHEIHGQEPFRQRKMAAVHDRADGNGSLVAAGAALDHPVRESIMLIATALRTLKAVRPPLLFQVIPALLFCGKSLLKLVQRQSLLPRHDSFPRFPVIMPSFYQLNCPIFRSWPWLTKRDNHLLQLHILVEIRIHLRYHFL